MTIDLLECFCAVAKALSFKRAASELSVSVSVVSSNVKRLEQELGVPLFQRTTRHVSLTHEGAALLPYAQELLTARSALRDAAARLECGSAGVFRIADWPLLQPLLEPILYDFLQRHPGIEPKSISMHPTEVPDAVREARVDVGLAVTPRPPLDEDSTSAPYLSDSSLCSTLLCTAPLDTLVVPVGHRFEHLPEVTVQDLADERLMVPDPKNHRDMHVALLDFFALHRIAPNYRSWAVGSQFELVTFVANGQGIGLVCDGLRFDDREPVRLVHIGGPVPAMDVLVISRPDPRPVVSTFIEFLRTRSSS